jgi:hypothetical protein
MVKPPTPEGELHLLRLVGQYSFELKDLEAILSVKYLSDDVKLSQKTQIKKRTYPQFWVQGYL